MSVHCSCSGWLRYHYVLCQYRKYTLSYTTCQYIVVAVFEILLCIMSIPKIPTILYNMSVHCSCSVCLRYHYVLCQYPEYPLSYTTCQYIVVAVVVIPLCFMSIPRIPTILYNMSVHCNCSG
jgi:hypothetical protein